MSKPKANALRKLLGQSFFIAFDGVELPSQVSKFIKDSNSGGVTLFSKNNNYETPAQLAELCNSIQFLAAENGSDSVPLAICVDHEGGRVQRFKKPFTRFQTAQLIGAIDSPKLAFEIAKTQAVELNAVGVNVNYAPVADINTNSKNPVIGDRAFGNTEERVSKMVSAFVRGYIEGGVQPVVKHFPGHGDTSQDSHFHLPKVGAKFETLKERELKPFMRAFKSRCNMVMMAHILLEGFDPKTPCTLSKKVIDELLRKECRYTGLILSDDMEMKAISDNFGKAEAALRALDAGVDILIYNTFDFASEVFDEVLLQITKPEWKNALTNIENAFVRITEFKKKHFLPYHPVTITDIESKIGSKEARNLFEKIEEEAKAKGLIEDT